MEKKEFFTDLAKGAALGTGILPGVSVGTVGLIVGIYKKLINALAGLRKSFKKSFITLLPIVVGCLVAAILLLWAQKYIYQPFPFIATCLFAAFILGGLPIVYHEIKNERITIKDTLRILIGILIAAGIGVLSVIAKIYWHIDLAFAFENPVNSPWIFVVVFFVGVVAAIGCLLPGISGAMIVFLFGLYEPIVNLFSFSNPSSMFNDHSKIGTGIALMVLILVGVIIGLIGTSKAMGIMMDKHRRGTYTTTLGFIIGSLIAMFINKDMWGIYPTIQARDLIIGISIFVVVGTAFFVVVLKLIKAGKLKEE